MRPTSKQSLTSQSIVPDVELLAIGLMAMLTVQFFRLRSTFTPPFLMWIECLILLGAPIFALWYVNKKLDVTRKGILPSRNLIYGIQAGAILIGLLFLFIQIIQRGIGNGDANEVAVLLLLHHVTWYLVVFSKFRTFGRTAFLMSCSLVLFVCFIAETTFVFVCGFFFAIVALWWLLGNYWSRLDDKALDGSSKTLPVNGIAILFTLGIVTLTGGVVWRFAPTESLLATSGFSFFSGGESGNDDPFARSGLGDGNKLTASNNASTAGAVDSDQFIEDDKPSIYDIMSEKFNGPVKFKKQNHRAVALQKTAKHLHDAIQSEQAGRSFRTIRERPSDQELDLKNKTTNALFFVEGSVPARFSLECFHHFNGWDWTKVDLDSEAMPKSQIAMRRFNGKSWFTVNNVSKDYLPQSRSHRVKVMRLSTNTLPASSLTNRWHIHRVETADMFRWNKQGIIRIDGETIPSHTMIDVVSRVPNYHVLSTIKNIQPAIPHTYWKSFKSWFGTDAISETLSGEDAIVKTDAESPLVQMPENETKARLQEIVNEWTDGYAPGWNKVDAIVNRFRQDFKYDPTQVASEQDEDSVQSFLDNGGGPSYLFASTATQALRAAGIRTRLVSGFLVQKGDCDRKGRQSIVSKDNLHMWPEVCIDGWHWIPVEPTPTFPVPYSHQTWWQFVQAKAMILINVVLLNPVTSILFAGLVTLAFWFWRELIVGCSWFGWSTLMLIFPSRRLAATRKLLDLRFWAAGLPRPQFTTISDWFLRVDKQANPAFFHYWNLENFSTKLNQKNKLAVNFACREVIHDLSFQKIKSFSKQFTKVSSQ